MYKAAKVVVMIVRLLALVAIVLGFAVESGKAVGLLGAHIGVGFLITVLLLFLSIVALTQRAIGQGVLGLLFTGLLPFVGLQQFPLVYGMHWTFVQLAHVLVAIAALGVAEAMFAAIKRAR